jgi:hypothetical protein
MYEHDTIPINAPRGSLQLPFDVQLTYKPWAMLSLGVMAGAGYEFFAWKPIFQYTGVGAEIKTQGAQTRPFFEAGLHVAYRW